MIKYTYYGDIDINGKVDGEDLTTFSINFNGEDVYYQVDGDIDFDHKINGEDLTVFAINFGKGTAGSPDPQL